MPRLETSVPEYTTYKTVFDPRQYTPYKTIFDPRPQLHSSNEQLQRIEDKLDKLLEATQRRTASGLWLARTIEEALRRDKDE